MVRGLRRTLLTINGYESGSSSLALPGFPHPHCFFPLCSFYIPQSHKVNRRQSRHLVLLDKRDSNCKIRELKWEKWDDLTITATSYWASITHQKRRWTRRTLSLILLITNNLVIYIAETASKARSLRLQSPLFFSSMLNGLPFGPV